MHDILAVVQMVTACPAMPHVSNGILSLEVYSLEILQCPLGIFKRGWRHPPNHMLTLGYLGHPWMYGD